LFVALVLFVLLVPFVFAVIPYATKTWKENFGNVVSGIEAQMEFPFIDVGIWEIDFIMKSRVSDKNIKNVLINVTKTTLPSGYMPVPGKIYTVWVINWSVVSPADFEAVTISYRVPWSWITQNNLTVDNISLYRYNSPTEIEELETIYKSNYSTTSLGTFATMESVGTNLSVFVIGQSGQTLEVTSEAPAANVTTETNQTPTNVTTPACVEKWTCGNWTACDKGGQSRTCTDENNCDTTIQKPAITQSCEVVPAEPATNETASGEGKPPAEKKPFFAGLMDKPMTRTTVYIVGGVVVLAVLILLGSFIWRKVSGWREHRALGHEFDRRVEDMWERKKKEEETSKSSEGRNLPGMPPKKE